MIRPIECRGISKETGQWVYGNLLESLPLHDGKVDFWINPKSTFALNFMPTPSGMFNKVIPDSVGQYTGAQTKEDAKVFDGDVLKSYHYSDNGEDHYLYHTVTWNPKLMQWYCQGSDSKDVTESGKGNISVWVYIRANPDFTISGNIHQEGSNDKEERKNKITSC